MNALARRILVATDMYYPPSTMGGGIAARRWVLKLVERGHQVTVVTPSGSRRGGWGVEDGVSTLRIPSWPLPHYDASMRAQYRLLLWRPAHHISEAMRRVRPELVHVHFSLGVGIAARREAKRRGVPVLATNHSLPENSLYAYGRARAERLKRTLPAVYSLAERAWWATVAGFYNGCDRMTVPTATMARLYSENGITVPTSEVSNGVDTSLYETPADLACRCERFRARFGVPSDRKIVLYAGRLDPEKRPDVLVDAFEILVGELDVNAHLVVAGRRNEAVEARCAHLGIAERVTFCGFLDAKTELADAYHLADVLASASECEGQGLVFLEGMTAGVPVVAADRYAVRDTVLDGETGLLFSPGHARQMAVMVARILQDPKFHSRLSTRARAHAREHDIERCIDRLERTIDDMVVRP